MEGRKSTPGFPVGMDSPGRRCRSARPGRWQHGHLRRDAEGRPMARGAAPRALHGIYGRPVARRSAPWGRFGRAAAACVVSYERPCPLVSSWRRAKASPMCRQHSPERFSKLRARSAGRPCASPDRESLSSGSTASRTWRRKAARVSSGHPGHWHRLWPACLRRPVHRQPAYGARPCHRRARLHAWLAS